MVAHEDVIDGGHERELYLFFAHRAAMAFRAARRCGLRSRGNRRDTQGQLKRAAPIGWNRPTPRLPLKPCCRFETALSSLQPATYRPRLLEAEMNLTKKKKQARRDQLAAQIMLTAYLESGGRGQTNPGRLD